MSYNELASVYDLLMQDVDYDEWADYLNKLINLYKAPGDRLLDLGCGTGIISLLLAQRGFKVQGVDISTDMLAQAEQKCRENNVTIPLYQQDIRNLKLSEKVDVVISTFDTFNYLLDEQDLLKTFNNINKVLEDKGLLIFDMNTYYYLAEILGNNVFTYNTEEVTYLWENYFDQPEDICEMNITFFVRDKNTQKYTRFDEIHEEKAYKLSQIKNLLSLSNFKILSINGKLNFDDPLNKEEKVFFIAQKVV